MSTDAIVLLKDDHKEVARLFSEFERKSTTDARKGEIVGEAIALLTLHTHIENEVMYPEVRRLLPDLEDDILESYEEHHVVDLLLAEMAELSPEHERFEAKMTVLMENVRHHVKEEEDEWFPKVRAGLSRTQLNEIGAKMAELKSAPGAGA